jgi:hypothetical protein
MSDRAEGNGNLDVAGADPRVAALEERVHRLEDVVAGLQDTREMEERVTERVAARVAPARGNGLRDSAGLIIDAGRHLLPAAVEALRTGAADADPPPQGPPQPAAPPLRESWLLFDVYAEARATLRMFIDPRYRIGWRGRLLPLLLLGAIVTSWIWLPGTAILPGFVSALLVKVVDLALAFVLFKILHREVCRYRETSPDLPPSLRL